MKEQQQNNLFWGVLLLILGLIFLLSNLGVDIDIGEIFLTYWPVILIAVGLKNLWPHIQKKEGGSAQTDSGREDSNP